MPTTYHIPFSRPDVGAEEAWAARKAVAARELTTGGYLEEARQRLAGLWGVRPGQVVLTSSGTAALWLAYKMVGPAEVPALTFPATANAGDGRASIYDCNLDTGQHGVAVGLWGRRPRLEHGAWAKVFDYCQCIGSLPPERGDCITCYSFNSSKPIVASGGGCAVFPDVDDALHACEKFNPREVGGGSWSMTNVQASILSVQLSRLEAIMARRLDALSAYAKSLPTMREYNVAVVSAPGRAASLEARLADFGVEAKRPWTLGDSSLYPLANGVRESLLALPTWAGVDPKAVAALVLKVCHLEGVRL